MSFVTRNKEGAAKVLAHPNSLEVNPDSLGLPSSVHIFDVTEEKLPAFEHTVPHRVSENADDTNAVSSIPSSLSSGSSITTNSSDVNSSRTRTLNYVTEDESANQVKSHPRFEHVDFENVVDSIERLNQYVSYLWPTTSKSPEAISTESDCVIKNNGKNTPFRFKYHLSNVTNIPNRIHRCNELHIQNR